MNAQQIDPRFEFNVTEYVGKRLAFTMAMQDEDGEAVVLTGYTGDGKIFDEEGTTILDLAPTIDVDNGYYVVDLDISDDIPPGRYDWIGSLIEASGDEHVRFRGKVTLKTY